MYLACKPFLPLRTTSLDIRPMFVALIRTIFTCISLMQIRECFILSFRFKKFQVNLPLLCIRYSLVSLYCQDFFVKTHVSLFDMTSLSRSTVVPPRLSVVNGVTLHVPQPLVLRLLTDTLQPVEWPWKNRGQRS